MKVIDFIETHNTWNLDEHDNKALERNVNIDLFDSLQNACRDLINIIEDDAAFCDAEWNFMHYWFDKKGFTENDYRYAEACGYERDQFIKEAI